MKKALRYTVKFLLCALALFALYFLSLFFHQQELPRSWVESICDRFSTTNLVVNCEGISVGFRHGLQVRGIRVFDTTRHDPLVPVCSVTSVSVFPFERRVRIVDLTVPRLGDAYYDHTMDYEHRISLRDVRLPDLAEFELELERGNILGIAPEAVMATVKVSPTSVSVRRIHLVWPDRDHRMELNAWCDLDLAGESVKADIRGEATQAQIRPLLVTLDLPDAYPYMDGFTHVEGPVRASCALDVDLSEPGFKIDLDLHPVMGRYNGVSMRQADGKLSLDIHMPGGLFRYVVTAGPILAFDRNNGELSGTVTVRNTNDVLSVGFDANSSLALRDVLDVIGHFNDGILDGFVCETPPRLFANGEFFPYPPDTRKTSLAGRFEVQRGSVYDVKLHDVSTDWQMYGESLSFSNVVARGDGEGAICGDAEIAIPDLDPERAEMHVSARYANGSVPEFLEFFGVSVTGQTGRVEGSADLRFPVSKEARSKLNGSFDICVRDGHITQTKLFAGLTKILAEKIPGVAAVVNLTDCNGHGDIVDGVVTLKNFRIEGTVFSIVADGTYDIVSRKIDMRCRLTFMRQSNVVGQVLKPILWTLSKSLMEVRVTGTPKDPQWNYIGLIDKMQGK